MVITQVNFADNVQPRCGDTKIGILLKDVQDALKYTRAHEYKYMYTHEVFRLAR